MRKIYEIAREISTDWHKPNYAAVPYIKAMYSLTAIDDKYVFDSGRDIVQRFLLNAGTWRGDVARRVKAELRGMVSDV